MKPYYEHAGITIYHGDCREILPHISAHALITDPPYGVQVGDSDMRGGSHGLAKGSYLSYCDTYENYLSIVVPVIWGCLSVVERGAVFCAGSNMQELPKASALGGIYCSAGVGRHCWGFNSFRPILLYGVDPQLHKGGRPTVMASNAVAEKNGHPTPKPIAWMKWVVSRVSLESEVVLDPFMGSGTTLVAAKNLNRRAIGIEIEERYCEIAASRLSQEVMDFSEGAA